MQATSSVINQRTSTGTVTGKASTKHTFANTTVLVQGEDPGQAAASQAPDFERAVAQAWANWPRLSRQRPADACAKRLLDVVAAATLLLILLPVLVAVALAVRLTSPGPIFFSQERVGRNGRRFRMYKFRSMFHNCDSSAHQAYYKALVSGQAKQEGGSFKMANDPRITPVGRWLRRTSLDELPQLWNVLKGDMALVGPRPPLPYEVELYGPRDLMRLSVTPGITGLWQVAGRAALDFKQMIDLDLTYVVRWSLWLDLCILLRTPFIVLSGRGAV